MTESRLIFDLWHFFKIELGIEDSKNKIKRNTSHKNEISFQVAMESGIKCDTCFF